LIDDEISVVVATILVVTVAFASFQLFFSGRVVEPFSEMAVLGPEMKVEGYPKTLDVNESFRLHLYIGNHEGRVVYYKVCVKVGSNSTFINGIVPADVPVATFYEVILASGTNKTLQMELSLQKPMVNGRLIFEMWVLNPKSLEFNYHGNWCQLWLNVTKPAT